MPAIRKAPTPQDVRRAKAVTTSKPKHKKPTAVKKKTSSHSSKSVRTKNVESVRVNVENQSTYNKLIKNGMSDAQAKAFAHHAGGGIGGRSKGGKSSKPITKRVSRSGKR